MRFFFNLLAGIYGLSAFLVALGLAWLILANCNYLYGSWHDHGGIREAIEKYGPQNRYRNNFENTSREQRIELFSKIVSAVHNKGKGLNQIFYSSENWPAVPLLQSAEIIHLKDVAKLISLLAWVLITVTCFWTLITILMIYRKSALPGIKAQVIGIAVIFSVAGIVILIFGWENIFNQFHIWIFPQEHQWFFYYQDSLMSTMMWAPHLFTYIGLSWLVLAVLFFGLLLTLQQYLNRRFSVRVT